MTDPERAAFVEWFIVQQGRCPWHEDIAEIAAQAVEKAVLAERASELDDYSIPWRAAMETAGVSGQGDASKPNPIGHPAQAAEPPQLSDNYKRGIMAAAYADCERIARDLAEQADLIGEGEIAHNIVTAIAAKRKEVCGE